MSTADDELPYVVEPLALRGSLTVIAGRHSSGKSWLVTLLGSAVHRGRTELAGFTLTPTTALYVDAENGLRLLARRFRIAGIPADGLKIVDGSELRLPKDLGLLGKLVEHTGAGLVVLDSLRRLAPGARENDSDDMAPILAGLAKLARDHDVAVVLVHHSSVKSGAAPTRGSSAIEDQADAVFLLDRQRSDDEDRRKLTVEKFRPDADPPTRWLRLANDPDSNLFALSAAGARPEHEADTPSEDERVAARIRALADQVRADVEAGGWPPGRIAAAVGRDPADGTFARALKLVRADGGWEATGATTSRRYRPSATLATLADPLRDGRNGESEAGAGCDRERGA